ncbi:hypothetical protein [Flavobacterium sp. N502540]|uniref:hypothetical protein n=1 Tax=Flavobacterium sp. N502540 TaxID=2986838 RepID=UPI002224EABC|nr:hypothetical protein [Flavobacterium sp. N502540]
MSLRLLFLILVLSFNYSVFSQTNEPHNINQKPDNKTVPPQTDYIKILWLNKQGVLQLNEDYIKTLTDPQRAALGFVTTGVDHDCYWDSDKKADESNLKCKFLWALNLGYQCSETHLGFLKQWFKEDPEVLGRLQYCSKNETTPKNKEFFLWLKMATTDNNIKIIYSAVGIDNDANSNWKWTEASSYSYTNTGIKQISRKNLDGGFF